MSELAKRFLDHNKTSAIVIAEWLDKNHKPPKGPPETWKFQRLQLEDGTIYTLPTEDKEWINKNGFKTRWGAPNGEVIEI